MESDGHTLAVPQAVRQGRGFPTKEVVSLGFARGPGGGGGGMFSAWVGGGFEGSPLFGGGLERKPKQDPPN